MVGKFLLTRQPFTIYETVSYADLIALCILGNLFVLFRESFVTLLLNLIHTSPPAHPPTPMRSVYGGLNFKYYGQQASTVCNR